MAAMSKSLVCLLAVAAAAAVLASGTALCFVGSAPRDAARTPAVGSSRGQVATAAVAEDRGVNVEVAAEEPEAANAGELLRAVVSIAAALLVAFAPMAEAQAARSGGRIGGSMSRMRSGPRRAPPVQKERIVERNSTTVVRPGYGPGVGYAAPPVMYAQPSLGGMIAGAAVQGATYGAVSGAMMGPRSTGPTATDQMLQNQMRQDERTMDKQAAEISDLKRQIAELQQKK